jgi:DNA-binding NtrC family response regulator
MRNRCENPSVKEYPRYGGRGIKVCKRWLKFENFLKDMGIPKTGMSIERIDNNKDYSPSNCRWATKKEQANNRRTNVLIEFNGEKYNIKQWAEKLKIKYTTLHARLITYGWSIEKSLTYK